MFVETSKHHVAFGISLLVQITEVVRRDTFTRNGSENTVSDYSWYLISKKIKQNFVFGKLIYWNDFIYI